MGERDGWVNPAQSVPIEGHRAQRRRSDAERVDRRTDVVHEAGFGELGTAGSAAGCRLTLDDEHAATRTCDRDRRDEPVGTRPDHDGVVLVIAFPGHAGRVLWPLLGWRLVARKPRRVDLASRQSGEGGLGQLDELDR